MADPRDDRDVKILLLEDSPLDAELIRVQLELGGYVGAITHVADGESFRAAIGGGVYDVVLCDYELPDIDGRAALREVLERRPDTPFIFVSGKLGEEAAVQSLHEGATDYVVKQRLDRLLPAVRRALHEAAERRRRRAAEAALRDAQSRLRASLDASEIATWIWDLAGDRVHGDANLARIFLLDAPAGEREAQGSGVPVEAYLSVVHPEDRARVESLRAAVREASGERYEADFRIVRPDGGERWLVARGRTERDERGRPIRVPGVIVDITEQKLAEQGRLEMLERERVALAEATRAADVARQLAAHVARQDRLFEAAISAIDDAVFVFDAGCRIVYANPSLLSLWGVGADEALGQTLADLNYPPDVEARVRSDVARVFAERRVVTNDTAYRSAAGADLHFEYVLSPVFDPDGRVELVAGTSRDVTARREMERSLARTVEAERHARIEAEHLGRMKDEFLATLSHELRTPLNAVLGWAQLLRKRARDAREIGDGLEIIERNARLQARLIEDLLDMSRIISGKVHLSLGPVDVGQIVRAAIEVTTPAADARQVSLTCETSAAVRVRGDTARLQQVVWNLLSNAVKFTPAGGTVTTCVERDGPNVRIVVSDTGCGIAPDFIPHVFERFRQANASITRNVGGLGLGLSIVKSLVEVHGGSVLARSEGDGRGAQFVVTLPALDAEAKAATGDAAPATAAAAAAAHEERPPAAAGDESGSTSRDLEGLSILVVDDEPDARYLVQRLLEERGATVRAAASADEGRAAIRAARPDLIVSDIGMPGEDGYCFVRSLAETFPAAAARQPSSDRAMTARPLPAIALTAFARPEDRERALAAGFRAHAVKPLDGELFARLVAEIGRESRRA